MAGTTMRGRSEGHTGQERSREYIDISNTPTYVIGDVHGCLELLVALEDKIVADASRLPGRKLIIMLGDLIDRGAASARVIARMMSAPPPNFDRICLTGNHELAMLAFVDEEITLEEWTAMGGDATLHSYGLDAEHLARQYRGKKLEQFIRSSLPRDHVDFLRDMPILVETPGVLFVHAGIDPGKSIADQSDEDLVFIRSRFLESRRPMPKLVVHGHTPVERAVPKGLRLNLDTGAVRSGRLTAARLWNGRVHVVTT